MFSDSMDRDANRNVLTGDYPFRTKKTITFAGGTTDAWGDDGGALDGAAIFTVTGVVQIKLIGECTTNLTGDTATVEVGITGATAIFMAQSTATDIDAGDIWINDTTPATYFIVGEEQAAADNLPEYILNGNDIILTVTTANVTAGVIDFFALWKPISDDGSVVASTN
ncbi:MAG: hypothetical protein PHC29_08380 [Candidatus Omnitrophica bacterium]|nr:hypothetical protein [Candidatus Omnitrophota bacterium]